MNKHLPDTPRHGGRFLGYHEGFELRGYTGARVNIVVAWKGIVDKYAFSETGGKFEQMTTVIKTVITLLN